MKLNYKVWWGIIFITLISFMLYIATNLMGNIIVVDNKVVGYKLGIIEKVKRDLFQSGLKLFQCNAKN